jgi:hypothetical protein
MGIDLMSRPQKPKGPAPKTITVTAEPPVKAAGRLKHLGGSQSDDWNVRLANDTAQALWLTNSDDKTRGQQVSAALAGLSGIAPKDELEGMMAAQLVAAHSAAMECYRRAMIGEQTFEGRRENLGQANKLSRTFAALVEALDRHRGKGQQYVKVEHVHIHQGGQAIVGAVTPGGGGIEKSEGQPHASAVTYEPGTPMWSSDPEREAMSVARGQR